LKKFDPPGNPEAADRRITSFWGVRSLDQGGGMKGQTIYRARIVLGALVLLGAALTLGVSLAHSDVPGTYTVENLSSNVPGVATHTDPDLQNGWGIAEPATGRSLIHISEPTRTEPIS
jgi:hypothetical protein